ncbi:hypothetical protein M2447_001121 [Ereboglobus sp. PH5-10]|uniref:hypothetical protein n=1 Tax=Ereboglobus sp. PH5-10 TaxID=2940629 RepID=UPI002406D7C4|nr:hypothetical protein [Ereboglobus sp. PH5-10]MDF9827032.1 hypothetical protein [Ereboglobus sp. PH5-10]
MNIYQLSTFSKSKPKLDAFYYFQAIRSKPCNLDFIECAYRRQQASMCKEFVQHFPADSQSIVLVAPTTKPELLAPFCAALKSEKRNITIIENAFEKSGHSGIAGSDYTMKYFPDRVLVEERHKRILFLDDIYDSGCTFNHMRAGMNTVLPVDGFVLLKITD